MSALRQRRVRWVVIAGVLVSIGTGDYDAPTRGAVEDTEVLPGQAVTVRVSANQDALVAQGGFYAELRFWATSPVDTTLRAVPEDFTAEPAEVVLRSMSPGYVPAVAGSLGEDDGGAEEDAGPPTPTAGASAPSMIEKTATLDFDWRACPKTGLCERTFRVERIDGPGDAGHVVQLSVVAIASEREPSGGVFCSSSVPKFGKNAAVTVSIH